MSNYITIFRQILQLIPRYLFERAVKKYSTDRYVKNFSTFQLLITLVYAQISGKLSLRDIETGLKSHRKKLYHLGLSNVSRSNLSYACKNRDCRVFEELFHQLLLRCQNTARNDKFKFKAPAYILDSTKINLCLSLFPWAKYRRKKGGIKLHQLLDMKSELPVFTVMTDAKISDIKAGHSLDLPVSSDSILVMDRGYIDFKWFKKLDKEGIFFVTRAKKNLSYRVLGQHPISDSKDIDDSKKIVVDERIDLNCLSTKKSYSDSLRMVTIYDEKKDKTIKILTNNFKLPASTIGKLYKGRWEIEKFFRWIKQNLKIKTFTGTSENAVMLQIWSALIYYLLLYYMKFQLKLDFSILELSRRIRAVLFEGKHLLDLLSKKFRNKVKPSNQAEQLSLF